MHFIEMHTTITALGAAHLYLNHIWQHHGLQKIMISDRSSQFVAEFTHEHYCLLKIKVTVSTVYYPQTDGQTECINQELKQYLCLFVSECQDNWKDLLPLAEFQNNNHTHIIHVYTALAILTQNGSSPMYGLRTTCRTLAQQSG